MKHLLIFALALLATVHPAAAATDFFIFKISVSLPVMRVQAGKVETKTFAANDIVNLALGRKLGSKVDAKTELLALATTYDDPFVTEAPAGSQVVIFNPQTKTITATVMNAPTLNFQAGYTNTTVKGAGFAEVAINELGDPLMGKLFASTLKGGASGVHPFTGPISKPAGGGVVTGLSGRLKVFFTDKNGSQTYEGFVIKGMMKTSGALVMIQVP
jgi:hypothetical protein